MEDSKPEKIRVLAFSYDEQLREAFRFGMAERFEILSASTLDKALEIATKSACDAIMTSAMEPMFEGLTLMQELKGHKVSLPTLLILGPTAKVTKEQALQEGFESVLQFPFTNAELREALDGLLGCGTSKRQRWGRKILNLKIVFSVPGRKGQASGDVIDISAGGAKIQSIEAIPKVGERLEFKINDENGKSHFHGTGLVRWTNLEGGATEIYSFGVKFLFIDGPDAEILGALLKA